MKIIRIAVSPKVHNRHRREQGHLPSWRNYAHHFFDKLWRTPKYGFSRDEAYESLADYMGLSKDEAHIGKFNVEQCKAVIEWSKQVMQALEDIDKDFGF